MGRRDNNKECDFKELGSSAMLVQLLCWDIIHQQVIFFVGFLLLVLSFQSSVTMVVGSRLLVHYAFWPNGVSSKPKDYLGFVEES